MTGLILASAAASRGVTLEDDFSNPPSVLGWIATGNTSLFQWDSTAGVLRATWDSRETNSYFALPLGVTLTRSNDFCIVFDLRLDDVTPGIDPEQSLYPFQISIGLINLSGATAPGFHRAAFGEGSNFLDFSFFPDIGGSWMWGPSLTVMGCDTAFNWTSGGFSPAGLDVDATYRVTMAFTASNQVLHTEILRDGARFTTPGDTLMPGSFNVQFDHLAVCNYNDTGWLGSILAHGSIDNVYFSTILPVRDVTAIQDGAGTRFRLTSSTGWLYTLQRRNDSGWEAASDATPGTGLPIELSDAHPPDGMALYRVEARRP